MNKIYQKVFYFICIIFLRKRVIELYKENDKVFGKTYYQFKYGGGIKYKYIGNNKLLIIKNK
jgi:hypothetical protein